MCDQCGGIEASETAGKSRLSRRSLLTRIGVGAGVVALGVVGGTQVASAASSKNGRWCNPAQGYFPNGGHFGADRGGVPHAGQDVTNSIGTAVYAAAGGTVTHIGNGVLGGRSGNGIIISHGSGLYTYYGHLNKFRVGKGATVAAGRWIADMGATGNVTGPHLHFETHQGGLNAVVNPVTFMSARGVDLGGGWPTLDPGASGETVEVLQSLITQRGTKLAVDGNYGATSVAAVKKFQSSAGLVADGEVGPKTWAKLVSTLKSGNNGSHVKGAQIGMNKHSAGLAVDGDFGSVTVAAVKSFQSVNRLVVDGECGPKTWSVIVG